MRGGLERERDREGGAEAERSEGREVEKAGERAAEEGEALRGGDWRRRGGREMGMGEGSQRLPRKVVEER